MNIQESDFDQHIPFWTILSINFESAGGIDILKVQTVTVEFSSFLFLLAVKLQLLLS